MAWWEAPLLGARHTHSALALKFVFGILYCFHNQRLPNYLSFKLQNLDLLGFSDSVEQTRAAGERAP